LGFRFECGVDQRRFGLVLGLFLACPRGRVRYNHRVQIDPHAPVLVTGSAGCIGRAAVAGLVAGGRHVRGFDRVPTPGTDDFTVGDLTDAPAVLRAAKGVGAIVHLAAFPDDDDFLTKLLPSNIIGLHNLLEAARLSGVKRVVLASTGQVVWWHLLEGPWPIGPDAPYAPRDWYAVTKVFAENAGRAYARNYGIAVVAVRLGWFPRTPEHAAELVSTERGPNLYFSPGDAGRFFSRAVEAPLEPGFSAVYAASRPIKSPIFDLEPTKRLLDWEPLDQWPAGSEHLLGSQGLGKHRV
jgi:uronate dehydrogenase